MHLPCIKDNNHSTSPPWPKCPSTSSLHSTALHCRSHTQLQYVRTNHKCRYNRTTSRPLANQTNPFQPFYQSPPPTRLYTEFSSYYNGNIMIYIICTPDEHHWTITTANRNWKQEALLLAIIFWLYSQRTLTRKWPFDNHIAICQNKFSTLHRIAWFRLPPPLAAEGDK